MYLTHIKEPNIQKTVTGEEHGLMKVLANSVPFNDYKRFKEKDKQAMKDLHKEQSRMIKAMYLRKKDPHERREMTYNEWDGEPLLAYRFISDHEYEVPKGLIDMINGKKKQRRSGLLGPNGKELTQDSTESGDDMFVNVSGF